MQIENLAFTLNPLDLLAGFVIGAALGIWYMKRFIVRDCESQIHFLEGQWDEISNECDRAMQHGREIYEEVEFYKELTAEKERKENPALEKAWQNFQTIRRLSK